MKSTRIPIDNCPHEFVYDDIADEDYCRFCGLVEKSDNGGWRDETIEQSD